MGVDIVTNISLKGSKGEIKSFINDYLFVSSEQTLIWDCEDFLNEKYPNIMKSFDKSINATGGRVKIFIEKDSITLTSKYGYCEEMLKIISNYYKKLIINVEYFDETLELWYGIMVLKAGEVYNDEYVSIARVEDSMIKNIEKEVPVVKNHLCLLGNSEEIEKILKNILFILSDIKFVNLSIDDNSVLFDTKNKSALDKILDKCNNEFKDIIVTFNFTEKNNKYYGFNTIVRGERILIEFIGFKFNKRGYLESTLSINEDDYLSNN